MSTVEPSVLDFWDAIDRVDPLPDTWMQNAQICTQLDRIASLMSAQGGVEYELSELADFMPPQWLPPPAPPEKPQSAEDQCKALDSQFERGLPRA
jgi:hypothetical protein